MEELLPILADLAGALRPVIGSLTALTSPLNDITGGFNIAMEATSALASAISSAAAAITGPFRQLGSIIVPFVQALNPSVVYAFQYAMRGLQATIGTALVPVMQVLIRVVREVSGILLPAAQALAPVFGNLAHAVLTLLLPPLRLFADLLRALAPVLEFVSGALTVLYDAWNALSVVSRVLFQAFYKFINSLFGGVDLKDMLKQFREAIHRVVEGLLKMVAYLAKLFGQRDFIKDMATALREQAKPREGAAPAPTDVSVKGFQDIARTMALAAFAAQPGGGPRDQSEREWLEHLATTLDGVAKDGKTFKDFLNEELNALADKFAQWFAMLPAAIADAINPIGHAARGGAVGARQAAGAGRAADRLRGPGREARPRGG